MKAIILNEFGGIENLKFAELEIPEFQNDEVLVKIKSISINPVDIKTRMGKGAAGRLKEYKPIILGWDISGTVIEAGKNVSDFKIGDEVFGMVNFPGHGKAYAEYVAAPAAQLALKPGNISHDEAAAATLAALTAWQALVTYGKIKSGDRVLIHAASGGVGHYAVQIAKYLGAYVIGTSSSANKNFVLGLGADEHIDYKALPFEGAAANIDFVLDTIGGDYIDRSLTVIKQGGTLISIVSGKNDSVKEKANSKSVNGLTMLVQSSGEDMKKIAGLLAESIIKSHVSGIFPFNKMAEAHKQIETGRTRGKIVVTI
jgi:NADPH:quinone reductase-like Zn-dependent oxidoreductase